MKVSEVRSDFSFRTLRTLMQTSAIRKNHLSELFALDLRSMGLFRIGIALILLYDLFLRSFELSFFYTDQGATPREVLWNSPFPMGIVWWISPTCFQDHLHGRHSCLFYRRWPGLPCYWDIRPGGPLRFLGFCSWVDTPGNP